MIVDAALLYYCGSRRSYYTSPIGSLAKTNRTSVHICIISLVAGAWTERQKMFHGGSFLKLADDNMDIQNPEAQNRELGGF